MAKTTDIGGKRLISLAPEAWVCWVTGQPEALPLPHLEALADAVLDFKQPEDLALWLAGLNSVTQPAS